MTNPQCINDILLKISEEDFSHYPNQLIFSAIKTLHLRNEDPSVLFILSALKDNGVIDAAGGKEWISTITKTSSSIVNIDAYIKRVKDETRLRIFIKHLHDSIDSVNFRNGKSVDEIINDAQQKFYNLDNGHLEMDPTTQEIFDKVYEEFLGRCESDCEITGVRTGYTEIDEAMGGLQPGQLTVLCARPAVGKTTMAINMLTNILREGTKNALFFSQEMSVYDLAKKCLSVHGRIPQRSISLGTKSDIERKLCKHSHKALRESALTMVYSRSTAIQLLAKARSIMRHRKIDVIFIDHLHELLPDNTRVTRVEQLGDTVSNIIKMARDLSVPVVLLAQLNRGIDSRLNKRPLASDLKGSGAIEEKADVILAIHREEDVDTKRMSNDTELMFLKNRHGPEGVTEKLIFRPNEMRFEKEGPMLEHF